MKNHHIRNAGIANVDKQRGVVLFISLIIIVAMMLTGLAIMRAVGAGTLITANLAFQQSAQASAEYGIEYAHNILVAGSGAAFPSSGLENDDTAHGYYAEWTNVSNTLQVDDFDPTTYDWSNSYTIPGGPDSAGNTVRYIIQRLCSKAGSVDDPSVICVKFVPTATESSNGNSTGGVSVGVVSIPPAPSPYYRITVRTDGPKNSVAYVQTIIM